MSLASHASERAAAELDYDNHPDDEGNYMPLPPWGITTHYTGDGSIEIGAWGHDSIKLSDEKDYQKFVWALTGAASHLGWTA